METNMKTRPFNAATHKPGDKLVCGGDPVTELIVGDVYVAGVIVKGRLRAIYRWDAQDGGAMSEGGAPLEVLIPEPEKPREWVVYLRGAVTKVEGDTATIQADGSLWISIGGFRNRGFPTGTWDGVGVNAPVCEVPDPEKAKAVETTEGGAAERPDSSGTITPSRPSTPACGYVPLHNGEPQWYYAERECNSAKTYAYECVFSGPVVECIVKPKPMTRDEARGIAMRYQEGGGNYLFISDAIDAILEAANGRAEGV